MSISITEGGVLPVDRDIVDVEYDASDTACLFTKIRCQPNAISSPPKKQIKKTIKYDMYFLCIITTILSVNWQISLDLCVKCQDIGYPILMVPNIKK